MNVVSLDDYKARRDDAAPAKKGRGPVHGSFGGRVATKFNSCPCQPRKNPRKQNSVFSIARGRHAAAVGTQRRFG